MDCDRIDVVQRQVVFETHCAVTAHKRISPHKMYSISIYVYDLVSRKRIEWDNNDAGRARV